MQTLYVCFRFILFYFSFYLVILLLTNTGKHRQKGIIMTTKEQFGASIKAIREQKDYTVRQAATQANISSSYFSQVENAKREIPSPKTLRKIAKGLRISEAKIFDLAGLTIEASNEDNTNSNPNEHDKNIDLKDALEDEDVLLSYDGKPIPEEYAEMIKKLLS